MTKVLSRSRAFCKAGKENVARSLRQLERKKAGASRSALRGDKGQGPRLCRAFLCFWHKSSAERSFSQRFTSFPSADPAWTLRTFLEAGAGRPRAWGAFQGRACFNTGLLGFQHTRLRGDAA